MHERESGPTRDLLFWAIGALIPVGIFSWFFHWQILDPTRVTWLLRGDWGTNLIGWTALRHDAWRWPLGYTPLIAWPSGATVTYTDSGPLAALLLKPFAEILPEPFQYSGAWLFACVLLQFYSAVILLRPHAPNRMVALLGATLIALMPTMLIRVVHPCLASHWTILLTLHAFINVERERRRDLWYGALLFVTALIHPYLLFMIASIWGSDVLRRTFGQVRAMDHAGLRALVIRSAVVAAAPLIAIWATAGVGGYRAGAGGFGYYSMALDGLFNPGLQGYSRILSAAPQGEGQVYEGFQYLGFGLLGVAAAAGVGLLVPGGRARLRRLRWLGWLAPALLVLTALAISDDVQLHGRVIAHVPYDWLPFDLPGMFRASGRLFWPCAYALVVAALQVVFALPRAFPTVICLTALLLQACDLTAFAADIRKETAAAARPERYIRTPSPQWEALVSSAEVVEFQPPVSFVDIDAYYEVAWRAVSLRRPVNTAYTSRVNPEQQTIENASRERFLRGVVDPRRLYVLLDGCVPKALDRSRLKELDGILIIPPATARSASELGPPKTVLAPRKDLPFPVPCPA